jgi:hypothetical protein
VVCPSLPRAGGVEVTLRRSVQVRVITTALERERDRRPRTN